MRGLAFALGLPVVTACSMLQPPDLASAPAPQIATAAVPAARPAPRPAQELLRYVGSLRGMGEGPLGIEAARQRQAAARDASDLTRMKAAVALTLAHHPEEGDIVSLVEPIARRDSADPELKAMAGFLQVIAADRRRLRESATAAGARLRDERRANEALKQSASAAQERAAQLQQKLDALTELEKSLSDRQVPIR